jgi:dipeptidyl aminopeptidase/acylaminoacyl peptidase
VSEIVLARDNPAERYAATRRADLDRRVRGRAPFGVAGFRVVEPGDPDDGSSELKEGQLPILPFGTWPSPISAEILGRSRVSTGGLHVSGGALWWTESRPEAGGLQVLVKLDLAVPEGEELTDSQPEEVLPAGVGVRSRVHEYGGGSFFVSSDGVLYTDQTDQGLWWLPAAGAGDPPRKLSPEAPGSEEHRYADARPVPGTSLVVALREKHRPGGQDDELVLLDLSRPGAEPVVLVSGTDFSAAPRPSPDGRRLAWLSWDLPGMPWDSSELWVAELSDIAGGSGTSDGAVRIAGGRDESVGQPMWMSEDELVFVSDRSGFWQPYIWSAGTPAEAVCDIEAEFHYPDWTLGQTTIAPLGPSRLACRIERDGRDSVVVLDIDRSTGAGGEVMTELDQPCVTVRALCVADGEVVVSGSTPTQASVIVGVRPDAGWRMLKSPGAAQLPLPAEMVSTAASMEFETTGGVVAQLNFYAPSGRTEDGRPISGPSGELPPFVVQCHGGPTGSAESGFDPVVQYWTTRGFALASVNYRGSAGRGRQFRKLLDGNYGIADAEDCLAAADFLSRRGLVDENRALVRGGSSAGLTALRASSLGKIFAGALVTCGVTDLRALATDTHKFESGYLEGLVGPYPEESWRYEERSPACRPELINAAVLLLQGEDDAIVPPAQAASLAEAIRAGGGRCDHVEFAGEGHGFRRAESISRAARLELEFAENVLGIGSDTRDIPTA